MLRKMVATKPSDPFPAYGLAMELTRVEDLEAAREAFTTLVKDHPSYIPSYLMFGNLLVRMGNREDALKVYDVGLGEAQKAGDDHAFGELQDARAQLRDGLGER